MKFASQSSSHAVTGPLPLANVAAPVLLLAFNRPDRLSALIESLRNSAPPMVRVAIDGPRPNRSNESHLVEACQAAVKLIDWTPDVEVLARPTNLGLERAVPDAVSWVLRSNESVIVIEDDVTVGPQFTAFAQSMLDRYRDNDSIMHISGYNAVPDSALEVPTATVRLSRIPESYAWATWRRAWDCYDPDLSWANSCSLGDLRRITGSHVSARRWRQNFGLAERRLISTWAYRWISSMWSNGGWCVSPNHNLVTYNGYTGGTHTRRKARWDELPIRHIDLAGAMTEPIFDASAEAFLQRTMFRSTAAGIAQGPLERAALSMLQWGR